MIKRLERLALKMARTLIIWVSHGEWHTQSFQLTCDDARMEIDTILTTYYR